VLRHLRRDRGAAAVEFALILPVLLLIIFGIIDFGRMLNAQLNTSQAAREGARVAMLGGSQTEVRERVNWASGADGLTTTVINPACPTNPGRTDDTRVVVTYRFSFVTPVGVMAGLFGGGRNGTIPLTGRGVMPCRG
jgi:Flp pilus assembly protein TadG